MSEPGETNNLRPTIASVDSRVARLEEAQADLSRKQVEQDGVMRLIQLEQQHIREIMTSRFVGLEGLMQSQASKLDNFIGKVESLIERGVEQQGDLRASALGRQIDERLQKVESWEQVSRTFHAEVRGMTNTMRVLFGTSIAGLIVAIGAVLRSIGVL